MTRPRRDPTGTRALFEAPTRIAPDLEAGRDDEGRTLLYSGAPRRGTVPVECGTCGARSRITLPELGLRMVPTFFLPLRRHPHWMRCPACERRAWCRVGWTG